MLFMVSTWYSEASFMPEGAASCIAMAAAAGMLMLLCCNTCRCSRDHCGGGGRTERAGASAAFPLACSCCAASSCTG